MPGKQRFQVNFSVELSTRLDTKQQHQLAQLMDGPAHITRGTSKYVTCTVTTVHQPAMQKGCGRFKPV
jgi:hypothetical protein